MLTKTTISAILNNNPSRLRLRDAIYNVGKLGYCVDHVYNSKGKVFLAIRAKGGKLTITDSQGLNVTKQFKLALGV
jgi:hypothetical protein